MIGEHRSTGDLLVLLIAGTVCFAVLATGSTVAIIEIRDPSVDTSSIVNAIADVINTLIGLLAGFLAGRTYAGGRPIPPAPPDLDTTEAPS